VTRATYHLGVLGLVGVMTLGGLGARWNPDSLRSGGSSPAASSSRVFVPGVLPVSAASVDTPIGGVAASDQAGTTGSQQAPVIGPTNPLQPQQVSARWVQNFRPTNLYGSPEAGGASLGQASQFTTFQLLETNESGWLRLFFPGRGNGALPGILWARGEDFGPSGPPEPQFELAQGGTLDPVTGLRLPERVGSNWPRIPSADLAVILDGDSGGVLYGKNAHTRTAPASLTKIMTAVVAIEHGRLLDRVRSDVDSRNMWESTVMGLTPGEVVSLETMLYGLMLPSGNDAAIAIARHIGGSEQAFVAKMNEKARAMGLQGTQFRNPHGLDEDGHYSTVYDLAMMSRFGMTNPTFYNLSAARNWQGEGYNLWNLNKLLGQYPGADGVKVGFTDNAGRCIVASASRDGHRVFVALVRSNDPVGESRMLLDWAFQSFHW
jgi:hypothetical protein